MQIRDLDGKNSDPGWKKFGSGINIPDPQHWKSCLRYHLPVPTVFFSLEANKNDSPGSKDQAIMRRYHRKKSYLLRYLTVYE